MENYIGVGNVSLVILKVLYIMQDKPMCKYEIFFIPGGLETRNLDVAERRLNGIQKELSPHIHGQLILDKDVKANQWGKESAKTIGRSQAKKINFDSYLAPYQKVNSKWIINLNVKARTIKLLEENIEGNPCDWIKQIFLRYETKGKIHKMKN